MIISKCGSSVKHSALAASIVLVVFLLSAPAIGGDGPGSTGAAYLTLPAGGTFASMGETGAANPSAPFGWLINPALLSSGGINGIGVFHSQWIMDTDYNTIFYGTELPRGFSAGLCFTYLSAPEIMGYDNLGNQTSGLKNNNFQGILDLSFSPADYFSTGINVKFFQEKIADQTGRGYALDVGASVSPPLSGLLIGASVRNIGPKISFISHQEELPLCFRLGGSYHTPVMLNLIELILTADMVSPRHVDPYAVMGGEIKVGEILSIRAGFIDDDNREGDGFTAGGGIKLADRARLDYAFTPYGELGDFHSISLYFSLGK